jgi:hypothetical protein
MFGMYILCCYRFEELNTKYDRARGVEIDNKYVKLEYFRVGIYKFNCIVHVYKVKPPPEASSLVKWLESYYLK